MSVALVFRQFAFAVLLLAGSATAAFPQADADDELTDPPGRVGRLGYMEGTVSFRNADEDQWAPATLNFPVTTGDAFWTEPNSRAEIQIGSTDLRLDQTTAIQIIQLDDSATQIQVDQGSINLRVRELPPGDMRIVTPRASVVITQPGRYHVDVSPPQDSRPGNEVRVAVLEGAARIDGLDAPLVVTAGNSATFDGQRQPLLAQAIARPLDTWALERERLLTPKQAQQYVSPEMTGAQDLDRYGQWTAEPTYGAVWYPSAVPGDWAPYRYGHWAYVGPWGWTWVDHQPWGFAPFHYGRWVRVHNRWGWCPGVRVHRPVYAPGLVAFAASGHGAILVTPGSRPPHVGWVPLGPHEAFRPHYRHSPRYLRNVNVTNVHVTNITVIDKSHDSFRSFHNRDAMTVVSAKAFTGAMATDKARVLVRDKDWADARRTESMGDFKPSRSARAGVVVPAVATAPAEPPQRSHRGGRDDQIAPPTNARPTMTAARDPDIVPSAPGPNWRRAPGANSERPRPTIGSSPQRGREPAISPLQRTDQAAPALRAAEPPGRVPNVTTRPVPPGRTPDTATNNRPNDPPGRAPNFNRGARDSREPANSRIDDPRNAPRSIAPAQPQPIPRSQMPGSAPHTVAPQRPTPLQPAPSVNQPNRRDSGRSDAERRRADQPRPSTAMTPPRSLSPSRDSSLGLQRSSRPEQAAPQRVAPPQMRQQERETRREPMRHDSAPNRTMMQQSTRPTPQQPTRQMAPQNTQRSTPQAAQAPSRTQAQSAGPRRSESSGQSRGRGSNGGGGRSD